jgi:hypothetical protein
MVKKIEGSFAVRLGCDTRDCRSEVQVGVDFSELKAAHTGSNTLSHAVAMAAVKNVKELGWKLSGGPGCEQGRGRLKCPSCAE